jgi:hypothetical protein
MSMRSDLFTYLKTSGTAISAIVGVGAAAKIYPNTAPQDTAPPYVTYSQVSNFHEHTLASAAGIARPLFQFICWDNGSVSTDAMGNALREDLDGFGPGDIGSTTVRRIHLENDSDSIEDPTVGEEFPKWARVLDFQIVHTETVPTF